MPTSHQTESGHAHEPDIHRVFLSYARTDREVVERLASALEARGFDVFWDAKISPGEYWQYRLENELSRCDTLLVLVGQQGVTGWVKPEVGVGLNRFNSREIDENFRIVPVLVGDTPAEFLPPFLSLFNAINIPHDVDVGGAAEFVKKLDELHPKRPAHTHICPYPGLQHYDKELQAFFFGRQEVLFDLLDNFGRRTAGKPRRWLQLTGNSGVGKSSLMRAGLLPALRNGWLETCHQKLGLRVLDVMSPGEEPVSQLAAVLVSSGLVANPQGDLAARLNTEGVRLRDIFAEIPDCGRKFLPLLPVDQFEELFTQAHRRPEQLEQFDRLLFDALTDDKYPLYLVSTMRTDFSEHFDQLPNLNSLRGESLHREIAPMTVNGLKQVIDGPAELVGLEFDSGLAEEILEQARFEPGSLPLINNLLRKLYEQKTNRTLSWVAYRSMGGLGGSLSTSAEELLESLSVEADDIAVGRGKDASVSYQNAALNILLALVEPGPDGRHTRRTISRERAWGSSGLPAAQADAILTRLSGQVREAEALPMRLISIRPAIEEEQSVKDWVQEGKATEQVTRTVEANPADRVDLIHETLLRKDNKGQPHFKSLYDAINTKHASFLQQRSSLEARSRAWAGDTSHSLLDNCDYQRYQKHYAGADQSTRDFIDQSGDAVAASARRQKRRLILGPVFVVAFAALLWLFGPWSGSGVIENDLITIRQCSNAPVSVQHRASRKVEVSTQDDQCIISIDGATKSDTVLDCDGKGATLYVRSGIDVDRIVGQGSCMYMVDN